MWSPTVFTYYVFLKHAMYQAQLDASVRVRSPLFCKVFPCECLSLTRIIVLSRCVYFPLILFSVTDPWYLYVALLLQNLFIAVHFLGVLSYMWCVHHMLGVCSAPGCVFVLLLLFLS